MTAFLFRATRYIGQYLTKLTTFRGLRYITSGHKPTQDKLLNSSSFASLKEDHDTLMPPVTSKLRMLSLPQGFKPTLLRGLDEVEEALEPLVELVDQDPNASLYLSMDAEWNVRRRLGVSILQLCPHMDPTVVYIITVHRFSFLPPSLLRLLTSERVWKIGSHIKGDLTRLRKQFPSQLDDSLQFSTIDLKTYALAKGFIQPKQTGTLASLCETVLGVHLPKDQKTRANNNWEYPTISTSLLHYAACDVLASRRIFERIASENESYLMLPEKVEARQDEARSVQAQVLENEVDIELYQRI